MFRPCVGTGERVDSQACDRRHEHDASGLLRPHLLRDALGQENRPEDIDLELTADDLGRQVDGRAALGNAGVVQQHVDTPVQCLGTVPLIGDVEFLDPQFHTAVPGLSTEGVDLGDDLDTGDHVVSLFGEAQ